MVLLTVTTSIQSALVACQQAQQDCDDRAPIGIEISEDSLEIGHPIAHTQLIKLSRYLRGSPGSESDKKYTLNFLLRGTVVYVPPPKVHIHTPEHIALMARLKAAEEARIYAEMTASVRPQDSFLNFRGDSEEETFQEVKRQLSIITNVMFSILGTAGAVWVIARYKPLHYRVALSMASAIVVAIAEAVIYSSYYRMLDEKRTKRKELATQKKGSSTAATATAVRTRTFPKGTKVPPLTTHTIPDLKFGAFTSGLDILNGSDAAKRTTAEKVGLKSKRLMI